MSNIGSNAGNGLRGGVHSVHGRSPKTTPVPLTPYKSPMTSTDTTRGAGEAIRGQINAFADSAVGSHDSAAQNQAISDRGVNEFQTGTSTHHNPGSSFDTHPSEVRAPTAGHHPGSSFDKHPSDVKAAGLRGNPGADNWASSNTTSSTGGYGSGAVPHSTSTTGEYGNPKSSNAGPHGSNVLNKTDPRVDSDLDNRGLTGNQTGAAGGPHNSNVLNKADPRVDSDFDNRGAHSTGHSTSGYTGSTGPSKAGETAGDPTGISRPSNAGLPTREDERGNLRETRPGGSSSTNAGPHDSNIGNKVDPRVDSDRDNRGLTGTTTGAAAGPHSSGAANKVDPRVDSDLDNRASGHHNLGTGVTPGSYGSEELASSTHNTSSGHHPSSTTTDHHNLGTGVTPGSYGSEDLATDKTASHRPDSGHAAHDESHHTAHVKDGESTEKKGSHPPHKSNLLNKLDPRVKTTSS